MTGEPETPRLWLMCDCETTGLLRTSPTGPRLMVLEIAWMLVDAADLTQLTPLRQRYTALWELPAWRDRARAWSRLRRVSPQPGLWAEIPMHPKARAMHEQTGLAGDWASSCPIRDVGQLDAAVAADVARARRALGDPPARLHLAGPGVAQYEQRLLPRIGSEVVGWCHYRCADTSVASMVSGVGKLELPDPADGLVLDLQLPGPGGSAGSGAHRAAGDVRTSWALASRIRQAVWSPNP